MVQRWSDIISGSPPRDNFLGRSREQRATSEAITLTGQRVMARRRIPASLAATMQITVEKDSSMNLFERAVEEVVVELEAFVFTQRLAKQDVTVPFVESFEAEHWATWWDQFKAEEVAPLRLWGWVARRWPPKTVVVVTTVRGSRTLTFTRDAMFPEATYHMPPEQWFGRPVLVENAEVADSRDVARVSSEVRR